VDDGLGDAVNGEGFDFLAAHVDLGPQALESIGQHLAERIPLIW
jgi:hypothetical protein